MRLPHSSFLSLYIAGNYLDLHSLKLIFRLDDIVERIRSSEDVQDWFSSFSIALVSGGPGLTSRLTG